MLRRLFLVFLTTATLAAEEATPLSEQPTPFSVWLDFAVLTKPNAEHPVFPIWFESFQAESFPATGTEPPRTSYRMRLRKLPSLQRQMLLRVYFDDASGMSPVVSAWSETGRERFTSGPLGYGVGLPTNESVVVPLDGTDYVEIQVPGDGTSVRGALASSLKDATGLQTIDFQQASRVVDPFGNLPATEPGEVDAKLFGAVRATLDPATITLSTKDAPSNAWEFELASQPLAAVVTFEILNADLNAPPLVAANDGDSAFASIHWPGLADPAFRGESRGGEAAMRFQYTGWLRAQCVMPRSVLRSGSNKIIIGLSEGSGPVAIRNVELQLKQNWEHLDYILTPPTR